MLSPNKLSNHHLYVSIIIITKPVLKLRVNLPPRPTRTDGGRGEENGEEADVVVK